VVFGLSVVDVYKTIKTEFSWHMNYTSVRFHACYLTGNLEFLINVTSQCERRKILYDENVAYDSS
jgi:hypothetical protein